jgi:hypothetical protein
VALSALPAGVTANPASVSLTPGTPQSITLTAANSAQAGTANVVFTGTSGSLIHTATLALTVAASAGVNVTTYHNDNARGRQGRRAALVCKQPFCGRADA